MNILSEAPPQIMGLRWKLLQWSIEEVPRTQQDKWDVDSAVSYPQPDPPKILLTLYYISQSLMKEEA